MNDENVSLANVVTSILKLKARDFSLNDYPAMVDIYNSAFKNKKILLKAGRQVSKSVTLAGLQVMAPVLGPGIRSLYLSNLSIQTARYSKLYLDDFLKSDIYHNYLRIKTDNVNSKTFDNSSSIELSYLHEDPSRVRGIPSDFNVYDEVQDLNYLDIPIAEECLSGSPPAMRFQLYAGTPKTYDNTIEALWQQCTKMEWSTKCERCGHWNIPDEEHISGMIGKKGPCCEKCKERINPRNGLWINVEDGLDPGFIGFHLPQIVFPMHWEEYNAMKNKYIPGSFDTSLISKWNELLRKQQKYPKSKFYNEVLGISQDSGGKVITLNELKDICRLEPMEKINKDKYVNMMCAGIDWGINAQDSYTVITVLSYVHDTLHVVYAHQFTSTDILIILDEIIKILKKYKVKFVAADRGMGHTNNAIVAKKYTEGHMIECQYGAFKKLFTKSKGGNFFMLDKVTSLDLLFMNMKNKKILLPEFESFKDYITQILSDYEEYQETPSRLFKVYRRNPMIPDDFLHALNFVATVMMFKLNLIDHNMASISIGAEV